MTIKGIYKLFVLGLLSISYLVSAQVDLSKDFEKAKFTMESKGDLNGAIKLFQNIIDSHPADEQYSAKSQFYIGICYEKLGLIDAKKAYQKVVTEYPDQTDIVNLAKEKISRLEIASAVLEGENKELQLKQVWAKPYDITGQPSPDGKLFSFVNWNVPCLATYNVNTGERKDIMSTKGTWDGNMKWAESSIWSPDGKKLAYVWYGEDVDTESQISIRVVGIDSSEPEVVLAHETAVYSHPCSWSSDGKHLLITQCFGREGHEIAMLSIVDKSLKSLKKFPRGIHPLATLSPDNKTIAYSFTPDLNSPKTDIYLLDIESGTESRIIDHPSTDFYPLWMPDGKTLIFFSDRTGGVSLWAQKLINDKPDGDEVFIKNLSRVTPMTITKNGDLFMGLHEGGFNVYAAEIDPKTGDIISEPHMAVETDIGWNQSASYSPDGKYMAYVSQRGVLSPYLSWGQQSLIIKDLANNDERELVPKLREINGGPISPPQWSPNGDEFLIRGRNDIGHNGAFILNIEDTSYTNLYKQKDSLGPNYIWSNNNQNLFYLLKGFQGKNGIYSIDRDTNEKKKLVSDDDIFLIKLHPNGNWITYAVSDGIKVFDIENNDTKVLYDGKQSFPRFSMEWSPDGKWLYFVKWDTEKKQSELWRISSNGENLQQLDITMKDIRFLSFHPDGKRLLFTSGMGFGDTNLWVMKNFLTK